jgi:hypothetical protein
VARQFSHALGQRFLAVTGQCWAIETSLQPVDRLWRRELTQSSPECCNTISVRGWRFGSGGGIDSLQIAKKHATSVSIVHNVLGTFSGSGISSGLSGVSVSFATRSSRQQGLQNGAIQLNSVVRNQKHGLQQNSTVLITPMFEFMQWNGLRMRTIVKVLLNMRRSTCSFCRCRNITNGDL